MALLFLPEVLAAQFHRIDAPADSYLWWTLSDRVTPAELKRLHSDRSLSLARYDAAVAAGLEEPLSEENRKRLKFYIANELTPELVPMWWAFDLFARSHIPRKGIPEEIVPQELMGYVITARGVETIMAAARACAAEREELMADLGPKQIEAQHLIESRRQAEGLRVVPPDRPILEAVMDRDYAFVASVTGRPEAEIRELVDALADWGSPRGASGLVAGCLPALKEELSHADWQHFRRYLREVIVGPINPLAFYDEVL